MTFKLIQGTKKDPIDYHPIYARMFREELPLLQKSIHSNSENTVNDVMRFIFIGVKMVGSMRPHHEGYHDYRNRFDTISQLKQLIGMVPLKLFMTAFPVTKWFKGAKEMKKDYFYTMDYLADMNPYDLISDRAVELTVEYCNEDIERLVMQSIIVMNAIDREEGNPTLYDSWVDQTGVDIAQWYEDGGQ